MQDRFVAPRNRVEKELAAIWQDLMGLERTGVNNNFFHLGGHSLMAIQIVVRIRQAFGVEFPLQALFEAPTIDELANKVKSRLLENIEDSKLEEVIRKIENLSEHEARIIL